MTDKPMNRFAWSHRPVLHIDKPTTLAGRTRCGHLMLDGECAICLGRNIEDAEFEALECA